MAVEKYILYILRVSKVRSVKIGITSFDRFERRRYEIERAFGKIDMASSRYFESTSLKDIKNLEKALHLIFWQDAKELKKRGNGSGHTEFFNQSKLKSVLSLIKLIQKDMSRVKGPFIINKKRSRAILWVLLSLIGTCVAAYYIIEKGILL